MKILIVDATNVFIRNYAVVPTLDTQGHPNGGVVGFLRSIASYANRTNPDRIILVWDGPGGSVRRRGTIKTYKQGRKPIRVNRDVDFDHVDHDMNKVAQRVRLAEYLLDLPVNQLTIPNIEADDVIAYLAGYFEEDERVIVSSDKDFYQLIEPGVSVMNPKTKELLDADYVYGKFKIYPQNFCLARAIAGDASDVLPGIPGIGLKDNRSRIHKYFSFMSEEEKVSVDQLLEFAAQNGKKYERFVENKQVIIDNYKVMQLRVPSISVSSILKIRDGVKEDPGFNATALRIKMREDDIDLDDYFFGPFRCFVNRRKGLWT